MTTDTSGFFHRADPKVLPLRPAYARSWPPRWQGRSSNGTNSSSTVPPPRWSSASCSSRRRETTRRIIAAFATYAVGFISRPLGGIVFGHFGDRYRAKVAAAVQPSAGRRLDLPDGLPAQLRCDRLLGAGPAGRPAVLSGLRAGRRMGRSGAAGDREQPERQSRLLGQLPAGRRARRQPARHGRPAGALLHADRRRFPELGLAHRLLDVGDRRRDRLLHSHQVSDSPIFLAAKEKVEREKSAGYGLVAVFQRYPRGVFTAMALRFGENILYYMVVTSRLPT